jgi:N-glycosylase/DNA lyase
VPSACPSPPVTKGSDAEDDDTASLLHNYFALSLSVSSLYNQWAASDANFARRAPAFTGIRILNQDAWEALVAFICSSNNNISRISQMVQKLCLHYGPYVATIEGEPFHDFPGPDALAGTEVEAHLRKLGFGYRAKYIAMTARMVSSEKPADWLLQLRNPECPSFDTTAIKPKLEETPSTTDADADADANTNAKLPPPTYRAAHEALLQLSGVGPKVADCVCLMGLGWGESVPIDTHLWQIAQRDYKFGGGGKGKGDKTLSKTMYDAVGDHFRKIWGAHAGWAQSVLFTANLKSFAGQAGGGGKGKGGGGGLEVVKAEGTTVGEVMGVPSEQVDVKVKVEEDAAVVSTTVRARKRRTTTQTQASAGDGMSAGTVKTVAVVKVEEGQEPEAAAASTVSQTTKRKRATVTKASATGKDADAAEAPVQVRRMSKRIRTARR